MRMGILKFMCCSNGSQSILVSTEAMSEWDLILVGTWAAEFLDELKFMEDGRWEAGQENTGQVKSRGKKGMDDDFSRREGRCY